MPGLPDEGEQRELLEKADRIIICLHMKVRVLLRDETLTGLSPLVAEQAYQKYCEATLTEAAKEEYRRLDYMRWLRFYVFYNWSYGPVYSDRDRQHPMLCGYERLTPEEKKERDAAWELLGPVSKELNAHEVF